MIGVHSAKFTGEKDTGAVRHAVERMAVGHPVVNDRDFRVWSQYAVRCWPTLMFIDPRGKVIGKHEGEINAEVLDNFLTTMIQEFEKDGGLDRRSLSFTAAHEKEPDRPLYFPGKALATDDRLFIADTGHHRIVESDLNGNVKRIIGNGDPGLTDGDAGASRFNSPEGLAVAGELLFVADTENHAIRRVDLKSGRVKTLAGTGEQAHGFHEGGAAQRTPLNSPWDVVVWNDRLLIAMAGFHQIWQLDLKEGTVSPFAGSGRENIVDGPRDDAQFAQPSGLALDAEEEVLYVADSEVSGIRAIALHPEGEVQTLVGRGLFDFGDVDGIGDEERLQHPLGLALGNGVLYIADSYNHKIKQLDPQTHEVRTVFGSGEPGQRDGPAAEAQFSEPGGVSYSAGKLFVADTNNHAIRMCDLATGEVLTMQLRP